LPRGDAGEAADSAKEVVSKAFVVVMVSIDGFRGCLGDKLVV